MKKKYCELGYSFSFLALTFYFVTSVSPTVSAHEATRDMDVPVGGPLYLHDTVSRPICRTQRDVFQLLTEIQQMDQAAAMDALFHIAGERVPGHGATRIKGRFSRDKIWILENNCKVLWGAGHEKWTSHVVLPSNWKVRVHGTNVTIVRLNRSEYQYTWLVGDVLPEVEPTQTVRWTIQDGRRGAEFPSGFRIFGFSSTQKEIDFEDTNPLLREILALAEDVPRYMGRHIVRAPVHLTTHGIEESIFIDEKSMLAFDDQIIHGIEIIVIGFYTDPGMWYAWVIDPPDELRQIFRPR